MGNAYQLAQINIGRMLAPIDDPIMADFVANLAPINALAESSPGFVWRFQTPAGDATAERPYEDDRIIINYSVWEDAESLRRYVYESGHVAFMRRRREWFERFDGVYAALWWVCAGHRPSLQEAVDRIAHLEANGPTPHAFSFARPFDPDGRPVIHERATHADACPAV